ncbi:hypothetical protein IL252_03825 [Halomicrobium sp. IBSBa]|nr:hypothetical protein [Halomicrobium sp. IBSBa]MBO4246949.1 hypothetical protein [Halomicrobium sp. IBSBa]
MGRDRPDPPATYVALACPRDNDDGLAFYDSEGLEQWGYVVETELDGDGN